LSKASDQRKAATKAADQRKAVRKAAAVKRAELALKHQFERIDLHEDVIKPMIDEIKDGSLVLELDPADVLGLEEE
jgi:hypothetical protein